MARDSVEARGESLESALEAAAAELGVPVDDLAYEVEDAGSKGLLGLGARAVALHAWRKTEDAGTSPERGQEEGEPPPPLSEAEQLALVDTALDAVDEILDGFDLDADAEGYTDPEGNVVVEVSGSDLGCLIGRRGQTLEAVQYLVSRVVSKAAERRVRVVLDAENYRARRREALEELALRTASRVAGSRQAVSLRPMTPSERRIVHMVLAEEPGVETHSEGEEPNRKVVVSPH
jgi:spoIIIJ-associated protein